MESEQYLYPGTRARFVAGLHWQFLPVGGKRGMRLRAREENASHWVAVPLSGGTLLGTVSLTGVTRGKPLASLALQLQPLLPSDGYAVFTLPDGRYWFTAAHAGRLSMFADVVGDETAVRAAAERFIQATPAPESGWSVNGPEGFFPGAQTLTLADLVAGKPLRHARLQATANTQARLLQLGVLGVAVGTYGLWHLHQAHQEQARVAAARAALQAEQQQEASGAQQKPWAGSRPLPATLLQCEAALHQVPISVAGWTFATADCQDDGTLTLHYALPPGGTVSDFAARLPEYYADASPVFNIPGNADDASFTLSVPMPAAAPPEDIPDGDTQIRRLTSYAQRLGAQLRLTEDGPLTQVVGDQTLTLPWKLYSFTFITPVPPDRLFADARFDTRGMRLGHVATALQNSRLVYTLEGKLYANR
ncbi:type 4b pilus protein PilO2 [Klebsiella michiganensis]|uniref:type 4b pilus protein PilO2 n=1 Tax=Klebsiella michiganensis TaxID=1134687 RepID=UPI003F5021CB